MRGILSTCAVLHTPDGKIVAYPAGVHVDIQSNDDWYHDVQSSDIKEAVELLE